MFVRLPSSDARRVEELADRILTMRIGEGQLLPELASALVVFLEADRALVYHAIPAERGLELSFAYGLPRRAHEALHAWLQTAPKRFDFYDPSHPEPRFRNVAMLRRDFQRVAGRHRTPIERDLFPRLGLDHLDELRLLACDGPSAQALVGTSGEAFEATPVNAVGAPPHHLVRLRTDGRDVVARMARAGRRWQLTRRHLDVLERLAGGMSNKEIAAALGCAEATVELHVSALLRRSGSDSRARLVARFWSEL